MALVEGKIFSFLGPEDNLLNTITYSRNLWAITKSAIPLHRCNWHSQTSTFINSSQHCQTLFQLPRTLEEVELLRTRMLAFFEIVRAWLQKLLKKHSIQLTLDSGLWHKAEHSVACLNGRAATWCPNGIVMGRQAQVAEQMILFVSVEGTWCGLQKQGRSLKVTKCGYSESH